MNINYFFCTKPLQYFNVSNIVSLFKDDKNILILIPNFSGANKAYEKIVEHDSQWDSVFIFNTKLEAFDEIIATTGFNKIFVDTDLHRELKFLNKKSQGDLFVYEEGLGTYEKEITKVSNKVWKNLLLLMAVKFKILNGAMGGNRRTKSIFVYDYNRYDSVHKNNRQISFPFKFIENYNNKKDIFDEVFELNSFNFPNSSKILLFLTGSRLDLNYSLEYEKIKLSGDYDLSIFKPHPLVGANYSSDCEGYSQVMAEILLLKLISLNNNIVVYHFGCAAEMYIKDKKVEFNKLDNDNVSSFEVTHGVK